MKNLDRLIDGLIELNDVDSNLAQEVLHSCISSVTHTVETARRGRALIPEWLTFLYERLGITTDCEHLYRSFGYDIRKMRRRSAVSSDMAWYRQEILYADWTKELLLEFISLPRTNAKLAVQVGQIMFPHLSLSSRPSQLDQSISLLLKELNA